MAWLLGYLLIGFFLHWLGAQVMRFPPNESWRWELATIVLWPLTIVAAIFARKKVQSL